MKKRSIGMMLTILLCGATLVFAADQDRTRTRDQKRLKNGSGQTDLTNRIDANLPAADRTRDKGQDRKRDGSCKSIVTDKEAGKLLAADQTRDRKQDRKRDGSCQG